MPDDADNPALALLDAHDVRELTAAIRSQTVVQRRIEDQTKELIDAMKILGQNTADLPGLRQDIARLIEVMSHTIGNGAIVDDGG